MIWLKTYILAWLLLFILSCGGGGDPNPIQSKSALSGTIFGREDSNRLSTTVQLFDPHSEKWLASATSTTSGEFRITNIEAGNYELRIGNEFQRSVTVVGDTVVTVFVPVPASPANFREVNMGPEFFCLLWDDRSGLETGFAITGPVELESPASKVGWVQRTGLDLNSLKLPLDWNDRFSGTYFLDVFNEYGNGASVSTTVYPHAVTDWWPEELANGNSLNSPDADRCWKAFQGVAGSGENTFIDP